MTLHKISHSPYCMLSHLLYSVLKAKLELLWTGGNQMSEVLSHMNNDALIKFKWECLKILNEFLRGAC